MPFNADTYYANKYKRSAYETVEEARAIKARIKSGEAQDWEGAKLPVLASAARAMMRTSMLYRFRAEFGKRKKKAETFVD